MEPVPLVRVIRSGVEEAVHYGSVAVADPEGRLVASAGDPERIVFARSSMKPLQAAVSVELAGDELTDGEVAIMAGSHNGEPAHVQAVKVVLYRAGFDVGPDTEILRCPPSFPMHPETARTVPEPRRLYHNCSGKHAGMVLACVRRGFDLDTYPEPDHPLQRAVLDAVTKTVGVPGAVGVDGCGVPVHAVPLDSMATLFARLVQPDGPLGDAGARVAAAMRAPGSPYLVAGTGRLDTALMETVPYLVSKGGAEGLLCLGLVDQGLGIALKVEDGSIRPRGPTIVRILRQLDAITEDQEVALGDFARPPVLGGDRHVGEVISDFELVGLP